MDMNGAILGAVAGYLLGSIPFGLILTKISGAGDLRAIGSGNIGATNVLRTGRKGLAATTLLLDAVKGYFAVWLAANILQQDAFTIAIAALFVVIGHCFPIWLKFKGGKGVATLFGVLLGLAWPIGAVYAVVWLSLLAITRISSVAGISAAAASPVAAWLLDYTAFVWTLELLALLVVWMHRSNIMRLLAGKEPRVGSK